MAQRTIESPKPPVGNKLRAFVIGSLACTLFGAALGGLSEARNSATYGADNVPNLEATLVKQQVIMLGDVTAMSVVGKECATYIKNLKDVAFLYPSIVAAGQGIKQNKACQKASENDIREAVMGAATMPVDEALATVELDNMKGAPNYVNTMGNIISGTIEGGIIGLGIGASLSSLAPLEMVALWGTVIGKIKPSPRAQ